MLLSPKKSKVRYAVVGLGHIAQTAVLPAFKKSSENSALVALVSGDQEKLIRLGNKYHISKLYLYSQFEDCLREGEVDAVYIATPNFYHRNIMETAAKYGVHVLCEKPMAVTTEDCISMISAAQRNHVQLMVAYRLHFETANLEALKLANSKRLGELKIFNSIFTMQVLDPDNIRLEETEKGGGPLYDIGIYCINAARTLFKSEPREVFAMAVTHKESRFKKTDETISAMLKFPDDKIATFTVSFGAHTSADYDLIGSKGRLRLEKAYHYSTAIRLKIYEENKVITKKYFKRDQFAPEIIHFSDCILRKKKASPSGEEGLADIKIIEALLLSLDLGSPILLDEINKKVHKESSKSSRPHQGHHSFLNAIGFGRDKNLESNQ